MSSPTCPSWCTDHLLEEDLDGTATDIHRGAVTRGGMTVALEDSPTWPADERRQLLLPDTPDTWISTADARDLAAALLEAARLLGVEPGR